MCGANDVITLAYPNEDWTATQVIGKQSKCSRAQLTLSWIPSVRAAGTSVKVTNSIIRVLLSALPSESLPLQPPRTSISGLPWCTSPALPRPHVPPTDSSHAPRGQTCLAARDNNPICNGRGPSKATPEGWFGETLCVVFEVQGPVSTWLNSSFAAPVVAYVGCVNRFPVALMSRPYDATIITNGEWPATARLGGVGGKGAVATGKDVGGVVEFRPMRGSEGSSTTVCVAARDTFGSSIGGTRSKYCEGGPLSGRSCVDASDCGGGGGCVPACITFVVQRCQYCVRDTDTLMLLARDYGLYVNWMRLWVMNSNQDMEQTDIDEVGAPHPPPSVCELTLSLPCPLL